MLTEQEIEALQLSVQVATLALFAIAPLGLLLGYWLARTEGRLQHVINPLLSLPLVLPPVAVGYGLLLLFGRGGVLSPLLRALNIELTFHFSGAVLAAAVVAFPLFVRGARESFASVDTRIEEASRALGATSLHAFFFVNLPLAAPGLLSAGVTTFLRAFSEFGATLILAGNIEGETRTLSLALFTALQTPGGDPIATRLFLIALAAGCIAIALERKLLRATGHIGNSSNRLHS